ncbi:ABC transporter ATP-binding protein [Tianweitania sediminis]|uniref:ABC transporter ATP-binding protein n=1 Tax=Tianweitania sediminis TaxID=1502156 RepID=A0A8J7RH34_9HYPH|nr:ABC transporter ATP-binding protein [Tianweitania sediminis]MBP0437136.1 ABC transporter ATP-binding protein [Tianweitania sediminis]
MTAIRLDRLTRRFGSSVALDSVSLDLQPGSFTALLGPSGCGKTTLLRLIAGFETPSEGSVWFGDRMMAGDQVLVAPEQRGIGIVFQSYALWPHLDVAGNVGYPLRMRGTARSAANRQVDEVLEIVGLTGFGARRIDELSGGQRQRVALARCLVGNNGIILFDEPLANLDMHLRATMVDVFRDIHQRTKATIVYVTHDQAEALALADKVAVMERGRVLQYAAPTAVYHQPADMAVARFVGRGNLVPAVAQVDGSVLLAGHRFQARASEAFSGPAHVLLRPEALRLGEEGLPARVMSSTYRGPVHELRLSLTGEAGELVVDHPAPVASGTDVRVAVADAWAMPG